MATNRHCECAMPGDEARVQVTISCLSLYHTSLMARVGVICTLDDFQLALAVLQAQLELVGNHLRYLVLLLW